MANDREHMIVALRERLQACLSSRRVAHARLDAFRQAFVAATPDLPMSVRRELLSELIAIRLLLNGMEGGGA